MHATGDDLHCDLIVLAVGVDTTELALMLEIVIPPGNQPGGCYSNRSPTPPAPLGTGSLPAAG